MNLDQRLSLRTAAWSQHSPFSATILRDEVATTRAKKESPGLEVQPLANTTKMKCCKDRGEYQPLYKKRKRMNKDDED